MKVSGYVSFALLAGLASALPAAKKHTNHKSTSPSHKTTAVVHTTPTHAKTTSTPIKTTSTSVKTTSTSTKATSTSSKSTPVVSSTSKARTTVSSTLSGSSTATALTSSGTVTGTSSATVTGTETSTATTLITSGTVTGTSSATVTGTETSTGTSTFKPVSCTDITSTNIYRRAFPSVPGIQSCKTITDADQLVTTLAANGDAWLATLASTQQSPPEPPSDIKDFLSKYTPEIETGKSLASIAANTNEGISGKIGSNTFNYIKLKTSEGKYPYQAAVSEDGSVLINTYSYTKDDVGGKNQGIMFEDIMTYLLAYNSDQTGFMAGTADIPAAVKKIKYIYRQNIENDATIQMIQATYQNNGWTKIMQKRKMQTPAISSKEAKGLIATNNGSLGPKLLGTNMKTFGTGSVSNVDIVLQPESMLLELTHG